jgi:antitoxin ParD1/3/4
MPDLGPISLSQALHEWVQLQASRRGESVSDYLAELLRLEQVREGRERVDAKLIEAIDSGPASEMTAQDWQEVRDEGQRRAASRRKTG